jgi:hypothetical protein
VTGRVLYGQTKRPVVGSWAVLQAVRQQGRGGAVDSVRTGPQGDFHLTIPRVDTSAFYVVSNWYRGIAYFSEPVPLTRTNATLAPILVYDTSSSGPPIGIIRRLVTIQRQKSTDGTRSVLELVDLQNTGVNTRITNDTMRPVWSGGLPHGTIQFDVEQGDIPPDAVGERNDSVFVVGPIPPGDPKELSYTYTLPATTRHLVLPVDQPVAELDLLVEDTTTVLRGPALELGGIEAVDQHRFARYRALQVPAGASYEFDFPNPPFRIQSLIPEAVALIGLALVVGLGVALRRPVRPVAPRRRKA